jgi:NAD+-dependent protein deacetylase SIR2
VPGEMIVEAHGSFASQRCIDCKMDYPDTIMRKAVEEKYVPRCLQISCNGLVKPDIVFFGEPLPETFHRNRTLPASADLAIVMGTSLSVQPFASLPSFVREEIPRVLINLERAGGLGSRADDVLLLGDCDDGVRKLADALGWLDELETLWQQTNPSAEEQKEQQLPSKTRDEKLQDEVDLLTREIDKTLKISKDHNTWLQDHFKEEQDLGKSVSVLPENKLAATSTSSAVVEQGSPEQEAQATNDSDKQSAGQREATAIKGPPVEHATDQLESNENGGLDHVFPHRDKTWEMPSL